MRHILLATAAAATALLGLSAPALAQPGPRPPGPPGSYLQTCRGVSAEGGVISAECMDVRGRWQRTTLAFGPCRGDISNQNGTLACMAPPAADNRERREDDRAAAAVAGAVAGALLGGPAPVYGDPRYGDPRFDPHYAEGGWGYGHRPGEWVSIRDRADWLNMRIDRAQREGRLSRGDARDLRRQLASIEDMEARDMRDGRLDPRERAELDHRFDDLQARIRFESAPGDRDGYRGDDRR